MSYRNKCEELYKEHQLLLDYSKGLEKVLEGNLEYIKELEDKIEELTGKPLYIKPFKKVK